MIKLFAVMLLLLTVSQCAAKCEFHPGNMQRVCASFEDFYNSPEAFGSLINFAFHSKEKQKINATILTTFPNIKEYNFQGSVNDIEDFTFAAPSSLTWIKFYNCELPIIRENSFVLNSDSNVTLSIRSSKVNYLEPNCFMKSLNLYELWLRENNIIKININVFNGTSIAMLDLGYNNIKFIEENALSNMLRLRKLNLDGNLLTSLDAKLYLNNTLNLLFLSLQSNQIEFLNKNIFISIPELQSLLLNSNKIVWLEDETFNGLTKLNSLNIAHNSLYSLPERSFPNNGLPSLNELDISNNRLNYLPKHFFRLFPKLEFIDLFGNPWQCSCYKDIIKALSYTNVTKMTNYQYLNGRRPVCVVPRTGDGKCNENIPDPYELYKTLMDGL